VIKQAKDLQQGDEVVGPVEGSGWVGGPFVVKKVDDPDAWVTIIWEHGPSAVLVGTTELEVRE
jgi:hypothetical protein